MRTEQPTNCFVPLRGLGERLAPWGIFGPPVVRRWPFRGGGFVVIACFWCQSLGDVSLYVCSYYFCSVSIVEWPPFGKKLPTRLTIF